MSFCNWSLGSTSSQIEKETSHANRRIREFLVVVLHWLQENVHKEKKCGTCGVVLLFWHSSPSWSLKLSYDYLKLLQGTPHNRQYNITFLKILTGVGQSSWIFASVVEWIWTRAIKNPISERGRLELRDITSFAFHLKLLHLRQTQGICKENTTLVK